MQAIGHILSVSVITCSSQATLACFGLGYAWCSSALVSIVLFEHPSIQTRPNAHNHTHRYTGRLSHSLTMRARELSCYWCWCSRSNSQIVCASSALLKANCCDQNCAKVPTHSASRDARSLCWPNRLLYAKLRQLGLVCVCVGLDFSDKK